MNIQNEEQRLQTLTVLKKFSQSRGWKMIREYLNEKLSVIEKDLFEVNPSSNEAKFTMHDLKRFERANILGLMDLPQNLTDYVDGFVMKEDETF